MPPNSRPWDLPDVGPRAEADSWARLRGTWRAPVRWCLQFCRGGHSTLGMKGSLSARSCGGLPARKLCTQLHERGERKVSWEETTQNAEARFRKGPSPLGRGGSVTKARCEADTSATFQDTRKRGEGQNLAIYLEESTIWTH